MKMRVEQTPIYYVEAMSEQGSQQQQREELRAKLLAIHRKRSLSATTTTTSRPLSERRSAAVVWGAPPTGTPNSRSTSNIHRCASLDHDSVSPLQRSTLRRRKFLNTSTAGSTAVPSSSNTNKRQKLEVLHRLRQKRIALAAQVEELRTSVQHLQGDTLRSELINQSTLSPAKTKNNSPNLQTEKSTATPREKTKSSSRKVLLPLELRQMRQSQCLAAAYRLAGISVSGLSTDPNILVIRLDVLSASYHCFFDVITLEKESSSNAVDSRNKNKMNENVVTSAANSNGRQTCLRLVQHTLPSAIPLTAILQRQLGGLDDMAELAPVASTADSPTLLDRLSGCANEFYHACYCWTVRNETVQYLEGLAAGSSPERPSMESPLPVGASCITQLDYSLDHLRVYTSSTATHQSNNNHFASRQQQQQSSLSSGNFTISFQLHHRLSGISVVAVTLQYPADLCRPRAHQPLQVTVRTGGRRAKGSASIQYHRRRHRQDRDDEHDDDDDDDDDEYYDEFVEGAVLSFRRCPIREALQEVVDAMQLY